jgi:hypothetical protein
MVPLLILLLLNPHIARHSIQTSSSS